MTKLELLKELSKDNIQLVDKSGIPVSLGRTRIEIKCFPEALQLAHLLLDLEAKRPLGKWRSGARQVRESLQVYTEGLLSDWLELAEKKIGTGEWLLQDKPIDPLQ